uniref:Uncharacterized protein n=1 Tax=Anguilla anguilla TaxID=7936 RepID=A0A0E9VTP6_ANGAN
MPLKEAICEVQNRLLISEQFLKQFLHYKVGDIYSAVWSQKST